MCGGIPLNNNIQINKKLFICCSIHTSSHTANKNNKESKKLIGPSSPSLMGGGGSWEETLGVNGGGGGGGIGGLEGEEGVRGRH